MKAKSIPVICLGMALAACTPTRVDPRLALPAVADWHHAELARTSDPAALAAWWQGFQDPALNALVGAAMARNQDVKIAQARVREVQALVTVAEAALYPNLEISASGGREKSLDRIIPVPGPTGIGLSTPAGDRVGVGLAARWEIDLFGGRHLEAEAAEAQAAGSREAEQAVWVGLLAQVATHYLELRGVQARTRILQENIAIQKERLRVIQALARAGLARDWDVTRQDTQLHATEAGLPTLMAATEQLIHRLGVLTGQPPAGLRARLAPAAPLPDALPQLPRLMPATLLEQRPDLRLAKTQVQAAAASLGAARADLFPKLVISASGGFGALAAGGFPTLAEGVYALGSGLSAPIFNAGRIRAQIAAADARLEQAATQYEKSFLAALEDVENAYVGHRAALNRRGELLQAEAAAQHARREADSLYRQGAADLLAVLDAQRSALEIGDARAQADTALAVSVVSLYRAMGGGWRDGAGKAVPNPARKPVTGGTL